MGKHPLQLYSLATPSGVKVPAMVDQSTRPETRVFASGSIHLNLAEKSGAFLPTDARGRSRAPRRCSRYGNAIVI